MKKLFTGIAVFLIFSLACARLTPASTSTPAPAEATVGATDAPATESVTGVEGLGGVPCPDSDFTCVTLTVPQDHFDPDNSNTLDVVFAILPATGERKGMFVVATGGPGTAGTTSADSYVETFDSKIPEHFDIVFFDQRGVGQSGGLQCVQAAADFYHADWDAGTPEGEKILVESSRTFASECAAEMSSPEFLPFIGTRQAVEDLELFRQAIGDEKIWLYGESYGTQYAQTYAAAHPDHLAALILDGTVDLTLSGPEYYEQQATAFNDVLKLTLESCNADELCAASMGGDAVAAYNQLIERLKQSPIELNFPLPSGTSALRTFSFTDLEFVAASSLYSESQRMIFLRSLAAYAQNKDLVPLTRLAYNMLVVDPETLEAILDPTYSDAVFFGVECQDYGYFSGSPDERAQSYLRAGDELDTSLTYFPSIFYGDMACIFWPHAQQNTERPAPLVLENVTTLVLGAVADPATPVSNGQKVYSHLADGYLITQDGGPHIIFARGVSCVDDLVTNFLVNGQPPAQRETNCEGEVYTEFIPPAPASAEQFTDALDALASADEEIYNLPEYYYWDVSTPTTVGCTYGGTFSFEATDTGSSFTLEACSFTKGFILTGSGSENLDEGTITLEVNVTGLKDGTLTYIHDGEGSILVTGTYGGETIELSE